MLTGNYFKFHRDGESSTSHAFYFIAMETKGVNLRLLWLIDAKFPGKVLFGLVGNQRLVPEPLAVL